MGDFKIDNNLIENFSLDSEILNIINKTLKHSICVGKIKNDILTIMLKVAHNIQGGSITLQDLNMVGQCLISFAMNEKYRNLIIYIKELDEERKIVFMARIYRDGNRLDDLELYPYFIWFLKSDIKNIGQYVLLEKIFSSNLIYGYKDKLDEILTLFSYLDYQVSMEEVEAIYRILASPLILNFPQDIYAKVAYLCFCSNIWQFIYFALNNLYFDKEKLQILIGYYYEIRKNYPNNNLTLEKAIWDCPISFKMRDLDLASYKSYLDEILNSPNKEGVARIISFDCPWEILDKFLGEFKKLGALSKEIEPHVCSVLESALVRNLDKKYLDLVMKLTSDYMQIKDSQVRRITLAKIEAISKILQTVVINNEERISYIIEIILNLDSEIIIDSIVTFVSSAISYYYSDLEFKQVISILMDTSDLIGRDRTYESSYFILNSLFTNEGVPFVDKNVVIDIAKNCDRETILDFSQKLRRLGIKERNLYGIRYGIKEDELMYIPEVMEAQRVRELLKK